MEKLRLEHEEKLRHEKEEREDRIRHCEERIKIKKKKNTI